MNVQSREVSLSPSARAVWSAYRCLERISKICFFLGKWMLILCMGGIFLLIIIQVFFRYVLKYPLIWSEEPAKWLMVWAAYLGAGIALREGRHISLFLLVGRFSRTAQFWILLAGKGVVLFFLIFFTVFGYIQAVTNPAFSWAVQIRFMWPMLGIPLAGAFMLVHILLLIVMDIARFTGISEERLIPPGKNSGSGELLGGK